MTQPSSTTRSVHVEQFVPATPERAWERLTTPEGIASWWAPGDVAAQVGHEFSLDMGSWGRQACRVVESDEPRRFAYTFGDQGWVLAWTVLPADGGCTVVLDHSGFDLSRQQDAYAYESMGAGWRDHVLPRLAEVLA